LHMTLQVIFFSRYYSFFSYKLHKDKKEYLKKNVKKKARSHLNGLRYLFEICNIIV